MRRRADDEDDRRHARELAVQERSQGADIAETIRSNKALAAKLEVNGTPAFVLEDSIVQGMMSAYQTAGEIT
ncbi:hypothetical protein [Methylobacterium sp.]|uniref:hypothetical protein n=1 Tax=Methylobacterium sp. TaxID=409 RepID=UPI003C76BCC0